MTSKQLASSADYDVVVVTIKSTVTVNEADTVYGVLNRRSGVVEVRCYTMPEALEALAMMQKALDAALGRKTDVKAN